MCGIAGLVSCDQPLDARLIKQMTDIVNYRGPDDEGFACWGEVHNTGYLPKEKTVVFEPSRRSEGVPTLGIAFGHRRLAIVDLSPAGRQPMASHDRRFWIIFNGEIYNYKELREELAAQGHQFTSSSDTEVILASYKQWGEGCLQRFNGMWALAIYDTETFTLFCSRDRFGVKPFYFAVDGDRLGFASEVKQLRAAGFGTGRAHRMNVARFLLHGNVNATRETLFEGIRQLLPGEAIHWHIPEGPKALQVFRYYSPECNPQMKADGHLAWYRESFYHLLTDSVTLRLRSDVPVGTCLSGGLDSSSIVITANRLLNTNGNGHRQKTFTSCFTEAEFDEWNFASRVVSATGVQAHRVFPQMDELWNELPNLVWHQDEPFGSTSIYAQWNVMRLAQHSGVKVLLDGQGADEVMAGYHSFVLDFLTSLARSRQIGQTIRNIREIRKTGILNAALHSRNSSTLRFGLKAMRRSLGIRSLGTAALTPILKSEYQVPNQYTATSFQQVLHQDMFGPLQALLRYEDRNSMAFSIEARTPFLDYRIVELFLQMPGVYKLRDGWTKPFLREAMQGAMPEDVRLRVDKKGFVTPEAAWTSRNFDRIRKLLLGTGSPLQVWIDQQPLVQWLSGSTKPIPSQTSLWRLISTHFWMEQFNLQ